MKTDGAISIWFFIGISLLVNGLLILAAGLYELSHPPAFKVVLYDLHAKHLVGSVAGGMRISVLRTVQAFRRGSKMKSYNQLKKMAKSVGYSPSCFEHPAIFSATCMKSV